MIDKINTIYIENHLINKYENYNKNMNKKQIIKVIKNQNKLIIMNNS